MAPYVYDYERELNNAMLVYLQYTNLYYPPKSKDDFIFLNECLGIIRNSERECDMEINKQSLYDDKRGCDDVTTTICALAQTLEGQINRYK